MTVLFFIQLAIVSCQHHQDWDRHAFMQMYRVEKNRETIFKYQLSSEVIDDDNQQRTFHQYSVIMKRGSAPNELLIKFDTFSYKSLDTQGIQLPFAAYVDETGRWLQLKMHQSETAASFKAKKSFIDFACFNRSEVVSIMQNHHVKQLKQTPFGRCEQTGKYQLFPFNHTVELSVMRADCTGSSDFEMTEGKIFPSSSLKDKLVFLDNLNFIRKEHQLFADVVVRPPKKIKRSTSLQFAKQRESQVNFGVKDLIQTVYPDTARLSSRPSIASNE